MNETVSMLKDQFSKLVAKLNIDISSHIDLIKALLLCLIFSPMEQYGIDANIRYLETAAILHAAHVEFGSRHPEEDFRNVWPELCTCFNALYDTVGKRPRRFFALFHEQVVADWDGLQEQLKRVLPKEHFNINAVAIIYYFSCFEKEYRKQRTTKPPYDFYLDNKLFPNIWFSYELTRDTFAALWNCMFYFQLDQASTRISKGLKTVVT